MVSKFKLYPLRDHYKGEWTAKARWTGEKRPPKKGEWYLSGAIVEAYRAPNNLSIPFHIAEIVRVTMIETYEVMPN